MHGVTHNDLSTTTWTGQRGSLSLSVSCSLYGLSGGVESGIESRTEQNPRRLYRVTVNNFTSSSKNVPFSLNINNEEVLYQEKSNQVPVQFPFSGSIVDSDIGCLPDPTEPSQ